MIRKSTNCLIALAAFFTVLVCSAAITSAAGLPLAPVALTESGLVIGTTVSGVNEFLGIPYAAPPMGALRWTPPKPYGLFHGLILQATQFGSACTQPGPFGSENCLFLNVYTPENELTDILLEDQGRGLPVMVYIHGGGLVTGAGEFQDPTPLVQQGVIVVTINYRLGYLGFFAQSALDAEAHLAGNYGLMDQQFALKWVQKNIAGFGGDPNQVTIFGESSGGQSVYANLASPTAARLFRGAISESGSEWEFQDYFDYIVTLATGATTGTGFVPPGDSVVASVGCSSQTLPSQTAQCLRGVPASALVAVEPGIAFPFVDGTLLTQTPGEAFASGQFNRVPVISGTNHDEWRLFLASQYDLGVGPLTDAEYPAAVAAFFGLPETNSFVQFIINTEYPLSNYPPPPGDVSAPLALGALGTDVIFACPARNADGFLSQYVTTYAYEFNDENAPPTQAQAGPVLSFPLGAYHTAELQYLFYNYTGYPLTPAQIELSDTMIGYWTQFAKTGNPNSPGAPAWSSYSVGGSFESLLPPTPMPESDASFDADHKCSSFWDP